MSRISLKICALCQQELNRAEMTVMGTNVTQWVCPTRLVYPEPVEGHWRLSHYWIEYKDKIYTQVINAPPYTITNSIGAHLPLSNKSVITPLYFDKDGHAMNDFNKMITLPRIPVDQLDKMIERIKLLILFS